MGAAFGSNHYPVRAKPINNFQERQSDSKQKKNEVQKIWNEY